MNRSGHLPYQEIWGTEMSGLVSYRPAIDWIEKEAALAGIEPSNLSVTGRYVLTPDIWPLLETVEPGAGG